MFDLRFINVAADDTYCMAEAKAPQNPQHIMKMISILCPEKRLTARYFAN